MIRRGAIAAVAAAAMLLAAGCGGGDEGSDELASVAPADAPIYLESVVRPEGSESEAIDALASKVGGIQDPGDEIVRQLDAGLASTGAEVSYESDIEPWLGQRVGIFFQSFSGDPPEFALAFETTDTGAAEDFIDKATSTNPGTKQDSYNGVDYFQDSSGSYGAGIVQDFLVFGSLDGFRAAVDASQGSSLADSSEFDDGIAAVSAGNLGLGYVDTAKAIEAATAASPDAQALKPALEKLAEGPVTFSVGATQDAASVDLSVPSGSATELGGGDLVGQAPAESWFALGVRDLGGALESAVDAAGNVPGADAIQGQIEAETGLSVQDLVSWMGDGYGFISGTSERTIFGGVVVESSDTAASTRAIEALRDEAQAEARTKLGPADVRGADEGFSASSPDAPTQVDVAQVGDRVVAALGPGEPGTESVDPTRALSDEPSFQSGVDNLGGDYTALAYVALAPFFVVAEKGGQANDPDYLAAQPYLEKLGYVVVGSSTDDERTTARFVVGVK
jgi:Protein of unknown function (DUF3352)